MSDTSGASLRLSNAERDRAVASLQSHAGDGRLSDVELQTRVQSARSAVTRGDLAPIFADLPGFVDFGDARTQAPSAGFGASPVPQPYENGSGQPFGRNGYIIVSITPFIAVILFFLSSWVWGFAYSWLWFLLVPIVGVIVYGSGYGGRERDRDRDRNRR